jgi:hypothetical protein
MAMDAERPRGLVDARVVGEPGAHGLHERCALGLVVRPQRAQPRVGEGAGGGESRLDSTPAASAKRATVPLTAVRSAVRACAWARENPL